MKTLWALLDDRAGNKSQVLGVAEALGFPFDIKEISYTKWVKLPNYLRGRTFIGISKKSKEALQSDYPDFVVSAGRRLYPVARAIRKASKGKTKIIHLMNPGCAGFDEAFLMLIPEHDVFNKKAKNVMRTLGAPHRVTEKKLKEEGAKFDDVLGGYPSPRLALIVGGSTKTSPFTMEMAKTLVHKVKACTYTSLFVTTSRRTPKEVEDYLKESFKGKSCYFYTPSDKAENPYFGFLAHADKIIVTGDSISMCTEACATGKPVYIFTDSMNIPVKHQRFHKGLYAIDAARPLLKTEQKFEPNRLLMTEEIAKKIHQMDAEA